MPQQTHWYSPHWRPGPYAPQHGQVLPTQFRTLPFELVRSHTFPKQERAENLAAYENVLAGRPGVPAGSWFLPKEAFQGPGSGARGLEAPSEAARRLSALQQHVLTKYLQGGALTPPEVRELAHMRMAAAPDYLGMARAQNRAWGGPPAGAHQVPALTYTSKWPWIVSQGRQQVARYGGASGQLARVPNLAPARAARGAMMTRMFGG